MTANPPTLFVSWRSPRTRTIHPVGRIRFDAARGRYEFVYIRGAEGAKADDFRPLPEFPELGRVYHSPHPFPLLANRLMPRSRPDYPGFLSALGLDESAHPLLILARSGGERQTDQIELFPVPQPADDGCYQTLCLARGVQYMPGPGTEARVARLAPGEPLRVMADLQNERDPLALGLRTDDNYLIGYLPAYLVRDARRLLDSCGTLTVSVERVNPPPAESHHRLLLRVASCWPAGFQPFADPKFQPIPSVA